MLTLIRCPFHFRVTAVACKRLRPFCQKYRWQVTPKHAYILDPTKSEWADYAFPNIASKMASGLAKTILQGTVKAGRRQGRQRKRWKDNTRERTGLEFAKSQRAVENLSLIHI